MINADLHEPLTVASIGLRLQDDASLCWRSLPGRSYLSSMIADLLNLPPILIQARSDEILLDDSRRFANCARTAGIDLTLEIWPNMWHCWHYWVPELLETNQAIEAIARYIHSRLENPSAAC